MKSDSRLLALRASVLAAAGLSSLLLGPSEKPWWVAYLAGVGFYYLAFRRAMAARSSGPGVDFSAACVEAVLASIVVAWTGGLASPLTFLYFPIVALIALRQGAGYGLVIWLLCLVGSWLGSLAAGDRPELDLVGAAQAIGLLGVALAGAARSGEGKVLHAYDGHLDELEKANERAREQSFQRERREEELYEERRKLRGLMEVAQTLAVIRNQDELLATIVGCAQEQMNVAVSAVLLLEEDQLLVRDSRGISEPGRRKLCCRVGEGLLGRLIRTNEAFHYSAEDGALDQPQDPGRFGDLLPSREGGFSQRTDTFRNFLAVPMRVPQDRNPLGLLLVANLLVGESFSENHEGYLRILATDAAIAVKNAFSVVALKRSFEEMVQALAQAIEAKDPCTGGHVGRVKTIAVRIARALRLSGEQVEEIRVAATLHDVGKISTPDRILTKPGSLTEDEFETMKAHARNGMSVLSDIRSLPQNVLNMVLYHHERWDGKGYPEGLRGVEIPLGAQIIAVADCYDAMISDRPYRSGFSAEEALCRMEHCCGTQFNAQVLVAFFAEMGYRPRHNLDAVRAFEEGYASLTLPGELDRAAAPAPPGNGRGW